jgi:prepilin-type N-terminal cleavage/methylation domain-containing protein
MKHRTNGSENTSGGFTLVEVLVVIAVIAILSGLLLPALKGARLRARIAKVNAELRNLADGLEMYFNAWEIYPPTQKPCGVLAESYNEYPPEVLAAHYVDHTPKDVFNNGPKYKYVAPGPGWWNGAPTVVGIWVPENYPEYQGERKDYANDKMYMSQKDSPVKYGLWSIGPYSDVPWYDADGEHLPVPRRSWYEYGKKKTSRKGNRIGIIARLSDALQIE